MKYLFDTDICIYFLKNNSAVKYKIEEERLINCSISEITVAELKYGVEKSDKDNIEKNRIGVKNFIDSMTVIPIITCLDIYAKEKVRLQRSGNIIDEFDLLIGSTAIANNLILVTNNDEHFKRLKNLTLENWLKTDA